VAYQQRILKVFFNQGGFMKTVIAFLTLLAGIAFAQPHVEQGTPPNLPQEGGTGWYQQVSGTNADLTHVQFTSVDVGYVGGGTEDSVGNPIGVLLRTTNGGSTWLPFGPPNAGGVVFFLNRDTGLVSDVKSGHLLRTKNAGVTWDTLGIAFGGGPSTGQFKFANIDTGYSVGDHTVARTFNGGKSWGSYDAGSPANLSDLVLFDAKHLLAVGANFPPTSDGCASLAYDSLGFIRQVPWCLHSGFHCIDNLNDSTVIMIAGNGANGGKPSVFRGSKYGFEWEVTEFPLSNGSKLAIGIDFSDDHNGTAVGRGGAIARTNDGGKNWIAQVSPLAENLNAVHFIDSVHGTAVGENGTIIHTTDAGKSWVRQSLPKDPFNSRVFPEPSQVVTNLYFTLPSTQHVSVIIADETGKIISEPVKNLLFPSGQQTIPIPVSNLPTGAYYYRIQAGNLSGVGRLTVVR
jgi:photosystem II stability/assembly factor-like uncharacterized protein